MYSSFGEQQVATLERLSVGKRTRDDALDSAATFHSALAPSLRPTLLSSFA
jgi:hypothetical protein